MTEEREHTAQNKKHKGNYLVRARARVVGFCFHFGRLFY